MADARIKGFVLAGHTFPSYTVLSARNLCTKRKGGKFDVRKKKPCRMIGSSCLYLLSFLRGKEVVHASVVFGIGKQLFTTEVVESSNPEWNQEAVV